MSSQWLIVIVRQWVCLHRSGVEKNQFACRPEIHVPQSVVFSQPGANVTLSCFIVGSPVPEAKWVLKVGTGKEMGGCSK